MGADYVLEKLPDVSGPGLVEAGRYRTPGNDGQVDPPPQEDRAAQLAQLRELKMKLDEDREREVSADALERYIDKSSETQNQSSLSAVSLE